MKKLQSITVKTGTTNDFFEKLKNVMGAADRKECLKPSHTLTFEDPKEMLGFLNDSKIQLINTIREHPDSISNLAKATHRNRSAVSRDIQEMEKFGLVTTHEEINPGHGRHKIVELSALKLRLEATL